MITRRSIRRARRQARRLVIGVTALVAVVVTAGAGGVAYALWRDADVFVPAAFGVGGVSFSAAPNSAGATADVSAGGAVTVTLPGSVVADDVNGPVIWQFAVAGAADGIAGLNYQISYPNPEPTHPGYYATVLQASTVVVYPAAAGGDCSQVPSDAPEPNADGVVELTGGDGPAGQYVLQQPAAYNNQGAAPTTTQIWCVSLAFKAKPDGHHVNVATATATTAGGATSTAVGEFEATVQYPNVLSPAGVHVDVATAQGLVADGTNAGATSSWRATLFPDLGKEPSVPITITPLVTSANPGAPTGAP